ncbi:hypothetical protein FK513_29925, partial [Klebsiella pneumoniae]|nr:hypothetical protein [Klebsiella pneumoniae]
MPRNAHSLMLTSNGNLLNKGSITGKGLLSQVSTVTGITNDGSIAGAYYLMLSSVALSPSPAS